MMLIFDLPANSFGWIEIAVEYDSSELPAWFAIFHGLLVVRF